MFSLRTQSFHTSVSRKQTGAKFTNDSREERRVYHAKIRAEAVESCDNKVKRAILDVLAAAGHIVHGADIIDYGWRPGCTVSAIIWRSRSK
jgi:hypothetical protein